MRPLLAPPPVTEPSPGATPSFSIVIAAYQAAAFIGEAIESALSQTLAPHEIVVCDDGSTDDLEATIAPYRDRIVFLRQENRGAGAAKTAAARAATADFVAVLDADDIYLPERLEALAEAAQARPDLDILTTDAYVVLEGEILRRAYDETWTFDIDDQRRAILERCFVIGHAAVRREPFLTVGGFDETLRAVVDWDLWLRMILAGSRAGLIPEPLSQYRVRSGSISTNRPEVLRNGLVALERVAARTDLTNDERATVLRTHATWQRNFNLARARASLLAGQPGVRRQLARVAFGRGQGLKTRLKAAASLLAPRLARPLLVRREEAEWVGAAGITVQRTPET
jgi:GT2 family glycosyltransferase